MIGYRKFAPFFEEAISIGTFREVKLERGIPGDRRPELTDGEPHLSEFDDDDIPFGDPSPKWVNPAFLPRNFRRCQNCTAPYSNFVPPAGQFGAYPNNRQHTSILFIGDAPNEEEAKQQMPFMGKAGQEFTRTYLIHAGLDRNDSRLVFTNACKCCPSNNRTPVPSQVRSCFHAYLVHEIAAVEPMVIVPLGNVALQAINAFSTRGVNTDPEKLNMESHHGFVFWRNFADYGILGMDGNGAIPVLPAYHPAAGMRDGIKMLWLMEDMRGLARHLAQPVQKPPPRITQVVYQEVDSIAEFETYLHDKDVNGSLEFDLDTEDDEDGSLYSVQISAAENTAVLIDGKNAPLLAYAGELIATEDVSVVGMHYCEHDWERVERQLNWHIPEKVKDTLKMAFGLGRLPKKLKALAYRLCMEPMTSFHDLVYPYSVEKVVEFLRILAAHPVTQHYPRYGKKDGKLLKSVDSNPLNAHINRLLKYTRNSLENPDEDRKPYPVWDKWAALWEKIEEPGTKPDLVKKLRELQELRLIMPKFSIRHVPRPQAVYYGCKDADVTGRVRRRMQPMLDAMGKDITDFSLRKTWVKNAGKTKASQA